MPGYQKPPLSDLLERLNNLPNDTSHKDEVNLLETLKAHFSCVPSPDKHSHLIAAFIFVNESIGGTYRISSPKSGIFGYGGSRVFNRSEEALQINEKNKIDDQSKFIYLVRFFRYVKQYPEIFSSQIVEKIKSVTLNTKKNLHNKITKLSQHPSTQKGLPERFDASVKEYEKACANDSLFSILLSYLYIGGRNDDRREAISILNVLSERLKTPDHDQKSDEKSINYLAFLGVIIQEMRKIEAQYKITSPQGGFFCKGSDLYKIFSGIMGIEHTSQLSLPFKEKCLSAFDFSLCTEKEFWEKHNIPSKKSETIKSEILNLRLELEKLKQGVNLSDNQTVNAFINNVFSCTASAITQSGTLFLLLETANFMVQSNITLEMMLAAASPQTAILVMTMAWVAQQYKTNIQAFVSSFITGLAAPSVDFLMKQPIAAVLNNVGMFNPRLVDTTPALSQEDQGLVEALYYAPEEIVSQNEKNDLQSKYDFLNSPEQLRSFSPSKVCAQYS
ncbi:MAG: hypothetical protein ACD_60C00038G0041 [uncultured bacterium]|nr:MAG: hypothetical protein ACD_60C00038G0041 [uncultured bacterium]